ncbi:MAG: DEAD/DEAH box helicase, partial [Desulfovibrio sp.]|nr:DEAD/DEAH box helicase [Desulfovibrio sp.]
MSRDKVGAFVESLLNCPKLGPQIAAHRLCPASCAEHAETRLPWPGAIARLLAERNIRLYSHQALATDHIRAGRSVVAATPTASGKSLIYNLPVLDQHLRDPEATALYLFPLKALAQDQLASFRNLCAGWPMAARPTAEIYDGDTSDYKRRKIRTEPPTALITNPEMLHLGIIPFHHNWATFLSCLSYIIVDEAHTYRGVFGSHMAQLFRRLNRITAHYGASPTYIFCTATLGNPEELAARLMGKPEDAPPSLIDKSGAPSGKRHFLFINPDLASSTCAIDILKRCLEQNLRTIVYCQSRRMAELISVWAGADSGQWRDRISSYRAGYLPEERREIEAKMASGELMAVVSTSALELGIDIGGLDVCILVGYPGTITQTLQRAGRVGRTGQESAVILVAGEDAMDQYFARHPD